MKAYQQIPIQDCGEPLVPIPLNIFTVELPPPYEKLGADYGGKSPYFLRQGVLKALIEAQGYLQQRQPGWRIKIFDAYRPLAVQQFMVDYTFAVAVQARGLKIGQILEKQRQEIWQQVYELWAIPSENPATPPPHSTGAAVDITLVNAQKETLDMGGEIDELSARSQPNYYLKSIQLAGQEYHARRQLLKDVMEAAGFCRHPGEWWHFSLGDQMWAWLQNQENSGNLLTARYGRV